MTDQNNIKSMMDVNIYNSINKIVLNGYMPSVWNNEMTDFITLIVLSIVLFIYTNKSIKNIVNMDGNIGLSFLFGYILGLGYPVIKSFFKKDDMNNNNNKIVYWILYILLILITIFIIGLNYQSLVNNEDKKNYIIYVFGIIGICIGLLLTKKNSKTYNSVSYYYSNGSECSYKKNGIFQSSGDEINITLPFLVFIILLFFSYEINGGNMIIQYVYILLYGILLGILVSSVSYYGIEYFLIKKPEKECHKDIDCQLKEISSEKQPNTSISFLKISSILFLALILIYLIYINIKR
jgi:hypothetical protein